WITAADINPNNNIVGLLSIGKMILFTDFTGTDYFNGTAQNLTMPVTQKEAMVFINNDSLAITDEVFIGTGGNLYAFSVANFSGIPELNTQNLFSIYPNPAKEFFIIKPNGVKKENHTLKIVDTKSKVWHSENLNFDNTSEMQIQLGDIPNGMYILQITNFTQQFSYPLVIIN
ncbi:MAG: T9SS type A sorting domain-containing protein, partial [Bacteroidia bacterium]|nr:T9SS type A sorting domain-containing protein [Bacteroidia bacterium]